MSYTINQRKANSELYNIDFDTIKLQRNFYTNHSESYQDSIQTSNIAQILVEKINEALDKAVGGTLNRLKLELELETFHEHIEKDQPIKDLPTGVKLTFQTTKENMKQEEIDELYELALGSGIEGSHELAKGLFDIISQKIREGQGNATLSLTKQIRQAQEENNRIKELELAIELEILFKQIKTGVKFY